MADCKSSKMIIKKTYFPSFLVFLVEDNEPSCCEKTVAQIIAEQCKKNTIEPFEKDKEIKRKRNTASIQWIT